MRLASTPSDRAAALIALSLLTAPPSGPWAVQAQATNDGGLVRGLGRNKRRTIYETYEFETDGSICGSLSAVKSDIEAAFLLFFEAEYEDCDSDRDVRSVVLVEFEEAEICSDDSDESPSKPSNGRVNVSSDCTRCRRRRLEGLHEERLDSPIRQLGGGKGSKGSSKGGSKGSSKGSKGGCSGSSKGSKSSKGGDSCCDADLGAEFRRMGFDDVDDVEITRIREVKCSSKSKDCKSTNSKRGACCGVDGCACNVPSESLCEDNDFCVEGSKPFDPDFCEDFGDTSGCESEESDGPY